MRSPILRVAFALALGLTYTVPARAIDLDCIAAAAQAVKQMPLECRPNRLGHIYGNNVRRIQQGKLCVNCGRYPNPVLRFFYIP